MRMVVKVAGALLDDAAAMESLARQVAQLAHQGHEILMVHGGGKLFTATLKRMGLTAGCQRTARDGPRNARCRGDVLGGCSTNGSPEPFQPRGSPQWASALLIRAACWLNR